MSTIISPDGKAKAVKNLGWILRNWSQVEYLGFNYAPDSKRMIDGEFVAKLRDGTTYISEYASLSVFWNWVRRPVFDGVKLRIRQNYDGAYRVFTVGNAEFRRINKLPYAEELDAILNSGECVVTDNP